MMGTSIPDDAGHDAEFCSRVNSRVACDLCAYSVSEARFVNWDEYHEFWYWENKKNNEREEDTERIRLR